MSITLPIHDTASAEPIVLYDLSPEAEREIQDALGPAVVRRRGKGILEIRRLVSGLTPDAYRRLLEALPEQRFPHTYDGETLEMMMTIGRDHEWVKTLLGRLLEAMVLALDIPIQSAGSTTLRSAGFGHGLEPDECYFIAHEPFMRGRRKYRVGEDPPPDLAIEVDVTSAVLKRLPIYAKLGVVELWRHVDEEVRIFRLGRGKQYKPVPQSIAFPWIAGADLTRFVNQRHEKEENALVRSFVRWAKKAHKHWQGSQD